MTAVAGFFNGLVDVVTGLLITTGASSLSPLQTLMWAGLLFGFIGFVINLVRRLASMG